MSKKKQTDQQLSTKINFWVGLVTLSALVGGGLSMLLHYSIYPIKTSPSKPQSMIKPVVVEVLASDRFCDTPIKCIRDVGEELGESNEHIMQMIRISQHEAKCNTKYSKTCVPTNGVSGIGIDPHAKNPHSSASGMFQVIAGSWYNYDCKGDKWNIEDNTRCGYKIHMTKQKFTDWEVYNNGSAK